MSEEIIRVEEQNSMDWNAVVQNVGNVANQTLSLSSTAVQSLAEIDKTIEEANAQIALADRHIEEMLLTMRDKQMNREDRMKQIRLLHEKMDKLIDAAMTLSMKDPLTDNEMMLIQMDLQLANKYLDKLPNL